MSGLTDLSGIASRAYTPGAKPAQSNQPGLASSETPENKRPARSSLDDRRLAPAFSVELSLAAQAILGKTNVDASSAIKAAKTQTPTAYDELNDGVGRREAPLVKTQRDVVLGSRLNIQI